MDLEQIKQSLASDNPQDRLRGITALRNFEPEEAAPILLAYIDEPELMVRSLIITGLGYKRTEAGFTALLEIMSDDADPNIRAEAVGAISKYGERSVPYLIQHSYDDRHWLSQMSIVLALPDLNCPAQLLEVCTNILAQSEVSVRVSAVEQLPYLRNTPFAEQALQLLLDCRDDDAHWTLRRSVALSLRWFAADYPTAQTALLKLRQDADHRVVAATLEPLATE
jgi:HEAT repeat protein